jgi:DNA-binding PadR family transcriptional regulator
LARETITLTDDEGTFLSLLVRVGQATAYQISKIYADSPVSNFGTSKGKIYPLIRRLRELGFIRSERIEGDARRSERLECTAAGIEAVRHWVKEIRLNHVLLEDPLRTKVQSFGLLTARERLKWVADAKAALVQKLRDLEEYAAEVEVPFKNVVHDNAVSSVECRLEWLDRLGRAIEAEARPTSQRKGESASLSRTRGRALNRS